MENESLKVKTLLNAMGYYANDESNGVSYYQKGFSQTIVVDNHTRLTMVVQALLDQGIQKREIERTIEDIK